FRHADQRQKSGFRQTPGRFRPCNSSKTPRRLSLECGRSSAVSGTRFAETAHTLTSPRTGSPENAQGQTTCISKEEAKMAGILAIEADRKRQTLLKTLIHDHV